MNSHAVYVGRLLFSLGLLGLGTGAWAQMAVEYYHLDAAGSVLAITDESGALVEEHDYDVFGQEVGAQAGTQPKRFAGKERDGETGWDYFGARYYGSKVGRFTTVDPVYTWKENLVDPQRWNRYTYAKNNPLRYVDPDGRETRLVVGKDRKLGVRLGHVGIYVDDGGGGPMIYDPSGSYGVTSGTRPEGGRFEAEEVDWADYLKYQRSVGTRAETEIEVFTFNTTSEQERAIAARARSIGDPRGLNCAASASAAIEGIGPFAGIRMTRRPGRLAADLAKAQAAANAREEELKKSERPSPAGGSSEQ